MIEITCQGTPLEIGLEHGKVARGQIISGIHFYRKLFHTYSGQQWEAIAPIAVRFASRIRQRWPRLYAEMEGIAQGSGQDIVDIVALNRMDGCTTMSWTIGERCFLGQNWDWMEDQKRNMVLLTIKAFDRPAIKMITEAGIIGKIGLNSSGVGVCLNAIRARGLNEELLPVHLALRLALEASSAKDAVKTIQSAGIAGSAHILIADKRHSISLEMTSKTFTKIEPDAVGRLMHTNHMLRQDAAIDEDPDPDSFCRLTRIHSLTEDMLGKQTDLTLSGFRNLFDDHDGFPVSICRAQEGVSEDATLFNIVMDLSRPVAVVKEGRLCQKDTPEYVLSFDTALGRLS
ncbi:hypothetical protein ANO11243_062020 [Dothideomycetidae sp. 11243]|nr:hypothetical protein ANO11243_062020 [fungal sp. No.11243]